MIEMTLTLALQAAEATRLKAAALGLAMTVSVVEEAGRLVLTLRGDGTGFLTTDTSRAKAVAALTFKRATIELAALHATQPFWSHVSAASKGEALPTGGAVPILLGGRLIGAIGCGGGSPEQDHDCAQAGAAAVAASAAR